MTTADVESNSEIMIKRPRGRPVGSLKEDRATPPTPKKDVINGQTYYYSYLKHKTKEGKTRYYKIKKAYTPATRENGGRFMATQITHKKRSKRHTPLKRH